METKVAIASIGRVIKQRNLFMGLTIILAGAIFLIALRLATFDQKIILVPGIDREMSISGKNVSASYLEESARYFLSCFLDISASDVRYKREVVLKYTSYNDPSYSKAIQAYFSKVERDYKEFDLSTHFTVNSLTIEPKKLEIIAKGVLTSWYGKEGHDTKNTKYKLNFEYVGGFLRVKEFRELSDEKEEEKIKNKKNKQDKEEDKQ